jgi:hypothetical protein
MHLEFVTDSSGKQRAVLIPIEEWKAHEKKFDRVRKKLQFLTELRESIKEMKAMRAGKLKETTIQEFLNEF